MPRVVVLGSSNTDMTVRLPRLPVRGETILGGEFLNGPGGKGANQAVASRRAGADVLFLTAVGDDDLGRRALDGYRREGIDITHARIIPGVASGVALIFVGDGGENMIGVAPGANGRLTPEDIDSLPDEVFTRDGVFLASLEVPLETVERGLRRAAKRRRMITVLNPAQQPAPPDCCRLTNLLSLADVLTPNRSCGSGYVDVLTRRPGGRTTISTWRSHGMPPTALRQRTMSIVIALWAIRQVDVDLVKGRIVSRYPMGISDPAFSVRGDRHGRGGRCV